MVKEKKLEFKMPRFGDPDYPPWASRILYKREINRLKRKLKNAEKMKEYFRNQTRKYMDVKSYINDLERRQRAATYSFSKRETEIILVLKRLLP